MHELPPDDRLERDSGEESGEKKARTKERLKQVTKDVGETVDELAGKRRSSPSGVRDTGVSCPHSCGGTIQEEVSYQSFGDPIHRTIGPRGRSQEICIEVYYCNVCATLFNHIP